MTELSPYWGDPVVSHHPEGVEARVDTQHEGVFLYVGNDKAGGAGFFGPEEARQIANNLHKAAAKWEED